jgi:hypothetical protein
VGLPSDVLWSKNKSCCGVDSLAMVGMICTQYKRHFLACPRAISTQNEPGTAIGTVAMAWRTVAAVGPSESLQLSEDVAFGVDGVEPQACKTNGTSRTNKITIRRRSTQRA